MSLSRETHLVFDFHNFGTNIDCGLKSVLRRPIFVACCAGLRYYVLLRAQSCILMEV